MLKKVIYIFIITGLVYSCSRKETRKEVLNPNAGKNPYDSLHNNTSNPTAPIDSHSFAGLHKLVLAPKCGQPACHDGTFEPDYRTVQSAYNTLVYATVKKTYQNNRFMFRVVPGDTGASWMHFRVTTNDAVLGRMPLYDTLQPWQLKLIQDWILDGAEDVSGKTPAAPLPSPSLYGILAYLPDSNNMKIDGRRMDGVNGIMPFYVVKGSKVELWIGIYDTVGNRVTMPYHKIRFSKDPNDFSQSAEMDMNLATTAKTDVTIGGNMLPFFYNYTFDTKQFNKNDIIYFRAYVKRDLASPTIEVPSNYSAYFLQSYFSFQVK